jgi:hypothetical protein
MGARYFAKYVMAQGWTGVKPVENATVTVFIHARLAVAMARLVLAIQLLPLPM